MKAKDKILEVTMKMLNDHMDPEQITVRDIAEKAKVNLALINYHFGSKENLIYIATGNILDHITNQLHMTSDDLTGMSAYDRLLKTMTDIGDFVFGTYHLSVIGVSNEMKRGSTDTISLILPVLNEYFKGKKSDTELKLFALQIITPLQVIFLNSDTYNEFLFTDLFDKEKRADIIKQIVDNVLKLN